MLFRSRDGTDNNRSWNHGVEGETDDPEVRALRRRQAANLMATLCLSAGVPMITAGDERGRTQGGNNNAYCLDDPTSWVDWDRNDDASDMNTFVRHVISLRAKAPALRQPHFFDGRPTRSGESDLVWFRPDGCPMSDENWFDDGARSLGMWIDGSEGLSRTREGELVSDDSWMLIVHAGGESTDFVLPSARYGDDFEPVLDTGSPDGKPVEPQPLEPGARITLPGRSLLLLRARR